MKHPLSVKAVVLGIGLLIGTVAVPAAENHEMQITKGMVCRVCGMYIEKFRHTTVEIAFNDGSHGAYCGVACGLRAINEQGMDQVKEAYVTDWTTQQAVPFDKAYFVEGSDIVPDMIPNIIAFQSEDEAQAFQKAHSGQMFPVKKVLSSISYQGMTMPFRITPAATPPKGVLSVGYSLSYMLKDQLQKGSHGMDVSDALKSAPMVPDKMQAAKSSVQAGYAFTDDLYTMLEVPYWWKKLDVKTRTGYQHFNKEGFGDLALSARYRLYHDLLYDKHFSVLLGMGIPTGEFNNSQRARPAMQTGVGAVSANAAVLYSQHIGLFWVHGSVGYGYAWENPDDYRFGDALKAGLALHFTPSTKTMIGLELDGSVIAKNEDDGNTVPNSGEKIVCASIVGQRQIALFWGGNFNLRGIFGVPIYEYVNNVQFAETFHAAVGVQWKRRF